MSNTNYDVELNISYNNTYRHYIPEYAVAVPYYSYSYTPESSIHPGQSSYWAAWRVYVSFDSESEQELWYYWPNRTDAPPTTLYNDDNRVAEHSGNTPAKYITAKGVFSKIYFRNPYKGYVSFNSSNCTYKVMYNTKAPFEVQLNSSGYIASTNASFKCSSVEKNIPVQYGWASARVYYKKSTDSTYSYVNGTVSGTWSDITVSTNLSLATGYTYNVYIQATADDGTIATTPVGDFATTDGTPITRCISPVGTYTTGTVEFVWSHSTEYGTPQYAYDLQYSSDNGGTWTTVANHVVSSANSRSVSINSAGVYVWRVRTYNTLDQAGEWAEASFINNIPATPPSNLVVTTKGRPTASWVSTTQAAYQVQVLLNDNIVYDSGAIYSGQNNHFINEYFDDTRAYSVRVRIYNSLGSVSEWTSTGYQQPAVSDVEFSVVSNENGGVNITIASNNDFSKYYLKRNDVLIGEITNSTYVDKYAVGLTNYSLVGVTPDDQSDIKSQGFRVTYPVSSIITLDGAQYPINKRVDGVYEIQTNNEADVNRAKYIGDTTPVHFFNKMKVKTFTVTCFDDNEVMEDLLGSVVFYADNFGNGGYCVVVAYEKTDIFVKNGAGVYGNEVMLTLEVTNYDDSIEYPI